METFLEKLCKAAGSQAVKQNEPMKKHTTFRIGGPADFFVTPEDEVSFAAAVAVCRREGMPYYILGNGSNLLVSDKGFRGVVIAVSYTHLAGRFIQTMEVFRHNGNIQFLLQRMDMKF